jgi:hypothetical protein
VNNIKKEKKEYSTGIPSLSGKTGERNKRDSNREGRSQIIPIGR